MSEVACVIWQEISRPGYFNEYGKPAPPVPSVGGFIELRVCGETVTIDVTLDRFDHGLNGCTDFVLELAWYSCLGGREQYTVLRIFIGGSTGLRMRLLYPFSAADIFECFCGGFGEFIDVCSSTRSS